MSSSAFALIGDTFQARIGIWKCWFLRRGENRSTQRKTSQSPNEPHWRSGQIISKDISYLFNISYLLALVKKEIK